jgi:redox-sensing transcriptional repressor
MSRRPAVTRGNAARGGAGRRQHGPGDATASDGASRVSGRAANGASDTAPSHGIPDATVARLPVYLRALYALADRSVATVSSEELAAATGVNSAKLRKDLSHLGSYGTRGVGYDVEYLVYQVSRELGLTQDWPVLIVGAGNLGRALANYGGFASRGFRIAALVDSDPGVVGTKIAGHTVRSTADMEDVIRNLGVAIGVIATPAAVAQNVVDRLVGANVTSILNFAPVVLNVPSGVEVRKVDLSIELQILAFHAQRRGTAVGSSDRKRDGRLAGRRIDGVPRTVGALETHSVPGGDAVPTESQDLGVAGLSATARLDVAAGLAAQGTSDDYETGVQAVGT